MITKQTRTQKQRITIIICAALVALLLPVYFLFVRPLLQEEPVEEEPPVLLPGEVLGANNRILLFEHVEKADLLSIEVHNRYGSYTFYRKKDAFLIKGMEEAPYRSESFSSLVVDAGYTLSVLRLEEKNDDLSVYGLGPNDSPAWYVLTKMDGTTHKVLIGNALPTGAGYYCMYEGRDAVYMLDANLSGTVLADVHSMITPSLCFPLTEKLYTKVDDFIVIKNGELLVSIDMKTSEEIGSDSGAIDYAFKYPEKYTPDLAAYSTLLKTLSTFAGSETVACGSEVEALDETEMKAKYGIDVDKPYFLLSYQVEGVDSATIFSEPDEDGNMYAYSTLYHLVAKVNIRDAGFVKWGLLEYVDPPLFFDNINNVGKIEVQGNIRNGDETLDVDAYFTLETGDNGGLVVKQNGEAKPYDADRLQYFRQFYKSILTIRLQDYAEVTDIETMTPLAKMTITDRNGEAVTYRFYIYSTRRCFYTVNGVGEFYVLRDQVEKLLRDADRILNGLPVDANDKT